MELGKDIPEEEVWKTINDLGKEKASGPDGYNIALFQHCWSVVNGEMMGLFAESHKKGLIEKSLNAIFISLLPKVAGEDEIQTY